MFKHDVIVKLNSGYDLTNDLKTYRAKRVKFDDYLKIKINSFRQMRDGEHNETEATTRNSNNFKRRCEYV